MVEQQKNRCQSCGHIIDEREIALFTGMVRALNKVWRWCIEKERHEFERKDIKHLFLNENEIARFGDWKMFGGLVYSPEGKGKKYYGLNMERCKEFFAGRYSIPKRIWKNPVTGELRPENYITIKDVPKLIDLLDTEMDYQANYRQGEMI